MWKHPLMLLVVSLMEREANWPLLWTAGGGGGGDLMGYLTE